jgi:hypothetical protein
VALGRCLADKPSIIVELIAKADVDGARVAFGCQISVSRQDGSENEAESEP